jgi:hypothetical protein
MWNVVSIFKGVVEWKAVEKGLLSAVVLQNAH